MDLRVVFILASLGIVQCKLINSCKLTKSFVDGHNARRLKLAQGSIPGQPAASKMNYLIWDEELAKKASNWAANNKYQHNPDRTVPSGKFTAGENIFRFSTSDMDFNFDVEKAMELWWDEHKDYVYGDLSSSSFGQSKQIGHYTQMAWAKTTRIGCGVSQYKSGRWNSFLVVCNYGPSGNYLGEKPYESKHAPSGRLECGESDCSRMYGDHC